MVFIDSLNQEINKYRYVVYNDARKNDQKILLEDAALDFFPIGDFDGDSDTEINEHLLSSYGITDARGVLVGDFDGDRISDIFAVSYAVWNVFYGIDIKENIMVWCGHI